MNSQIVSENNFKIPDNSCVLVTGGTGFTGMVLVKKLCEQGLKVRVIARPSAKVAELSKLGCEIIEGQVYDAAVIESAVKDVEYIFHVAAAFREPGISDDIYRLVHVESTQLLAKAALTQPNFKRFVHISTIGVHGHIEQPPADEEYRFAPGDIYQETKLEGELWLRKFATENQLPFCVIRPAMIYGPGDYRLLKLFKMSCKPFFPLLGGGQFMVHLTHVDDLTDSMILAACHPNALGQVFICGSKNSISLKELVSTVSKENGNKVRFIRVPVTPFFVLAYLCELVCKPFGINPPIFRRRVAFFTKDRSFDTTKIHTLLGHKNKHSNHAGLVQTLRWYKQHNWLSLKILSFELIPLVG